MDRIKRESFFEIVWSIPKELDFYKYDYSKSNITVSTKKFDLELPKEFGNIWQEIGNLTEEDINELLKEIKKLKTVYLLFSVRQFLYRQDFMWCCISDSIEKLQDKIADELEPEDYRIIQTDDYKGELKSALYLEGVYNFYHLIEMGFNL